MQDGKLPKAKEFGKDVSAFSNTFGGWLIYGIATDEGDEILPLEQGAIVGIENKPGLKEQVENMILSAISPKPFFRINRIDIPQSNRCVILVFVPQSYNHLHMVTSKGENRFYKRNEYSSAPMDFYEVKKKFEDMGQSEAALKRMVASYVEQIAKSVPEIDSNNLLSFAAFPKWLIEDYFNDRQTILDLHNECIQHAIFKFARSPKRKANRFFSEMFFDENRLKASINYFYNGILIEVMPIDLFDASRVNASAIYYELYYFLDFVVKYYRKFGFQGLIDLRFGIQGISGRRLGFIEKTKTDFGTRILHCQKK